MSTDMKTLTIDSQTFEIVDAEARKKVNELQAAVGSPLVASTASAMTDHNKVYVYTGSETGYTSGHWYYWNGSAWADGGAYNSLAISTDKTLSVENVAADAKKTGDEITDLKSAISGGVGIPADVKEALLACFQNVAWIGDDGQSYYDTLETALYPPAELVSISAVYTQSGTVLETDSLDDLKPDLVVTALYDDQTTATITTYTLSGTLAEGTSVITVSYGGKTTTFNVIVSGEPISDETKWTNGVVYTYTPVEGCYVGSSGEMVPYNTWDATPYLYCSGAGKLTFEALESSSSMGNSNMTDNAWYDESKTFISKFSVTGLANNQGATCDVTVPDNAVYFVASGVKAVYGKPSPSSPYVSITPYAQ